jgi:hypothetical protein
MANYGTKISVSGNNVKIADDKDLILSSKYSLIKISQNADPPHFGVYTKTFTSNPGLGTTIILDVNHGYSYIPMAIVYVYDVTWGSYNCLPKYLGAPNYLAYYTDNTKLRIYLQRGDATDDFTGDSYKFKYYIFAENGT